MATKPETTHYTTSTGLQVEHKHLHNLDLFTKKGAEYYYFLGAALTDGCISTHGGGSPRFTLSSKDYDWLLQLEVMVGGKATKHVDMASTLTIGHKDIIKTLMDDGCVPRKILILTLPAIPAEHFYHFLRGAIDGDGCVQFCTMKKKHSSGKIYLERFPSVYLCGASLPFLTSIESELKTRGIKCYVSVAHKVGETHEIEPGRMITSKVPGYRLHIRNRQAYYLLKSLGYNIPGAPALPRKKVIAEAVIAHYESPKFKHRRNTYDHSKENYYDHSNEEFTAAVLASSSEKGVLERLDLWVSGDAIPRVQRRMKELGLSFPTSTPPTLEPSGPSCKPRKQD